MKSKLISFSFLILSVIFLGILFQVNYSVRNLEKELWLIETKIDLLKESNKVLFSEYSAHVNPDYIKKLSSIYLDSDIHNYESNIIFNEKNFVNKINETNLMLSTSIYNYSAKVEKKDIN